MADILDAAAYFIFGLVQAITGYAAWVFGKHEAFTMNEADYPNIGTNPNRLGSAFRGGAM